MESCCEGDHWKQMSTSQKAHGRCENGFWQRRGEENIFSAVRKRRLVAIEQL